MGSSISTVATRPCRATHALVVVALALVVLALCAGAASAQTSEVQTSRSGLTATLAAAGPLVAPEAVLTRMPGAATQDTKPRFAFDALNRTASTQFECRLDGAVVECRGGEYAPAEDLAEGPHTFAVRATNAPEPAIGDWGPAATHAFRVDRTAPTVTIDESSSHAAPGGKVRLYFSADEPGVRFTCKVDDEPAADCDSPREFELAHGDHTITLRATDDALNASAPVTWNVEAVPGTPAANTAMGADPAATPDTAVPAEPRVPRIEIGVACTEVSAARASAQFSLLGRNAVVRFRAPAAARYAKFTLRRASGKRRPAVVIETLAYATLARAAAARTTRIALTRGQRRLVRAGISRFAVAYGTCHSHVGDWQWVTTAGADGTG